MSALLTKQEAERMRADELLLRHDRRNGSERRGEVARAPYIGPERRQTDRRNRDRLAQAA